MRLFYRSDDTCDYRQRNIQDHPVNPPFLTGFGLSRTKCTLPLVSGRRSTKCSPIFAIETIRPDKRVKATQREVDNLHAQELEHEGTYDENVCFVASLVLLRLDDMRCPLDYQRLVLKRSREMELSPDKITYERSSLPCRWENLARRRIQPDCKPGLSQAECRMCVRDSWGLRSKSPHDFCLRSSWDRD